MYYFRSQQAHSKHKVLIREVPDVLFQEVENKPIREVWETD